jgi:hypothetical protein
MVGQLHTINLSKYAVRYTMNLSKYAVRYTMNLSKYAVRYKMNLSKYAVRYKSALCYLERTLRYQVVFLDSVPHNTVLVCTVPYRTAPYRTMICTSSALLSKSQLHADLSIFLIHI